MPSGLGGKGAEAWAWAPGPGCQKPRIAHAQVPILLRRQHQTRRRSRGLRPLSVCGRKGWPTATAVPDHVVDADRRPLGLRGTGRAGRAASPGREGRLGLGIQVRGKLDGRHVQADGFACPEPSWASAASAWSSMAGGRSGSCPSKPQACRRRGPAGGGHAGPAPGSPQAQAAKRQAFGHAQEDGMDARGKGDGRPGCGSRAGFRLR